jgi:hypothetical protein
LNQRIRQTKPRQENEAAPSARLLSWNDAGRVALTKIKVKLEDFNHAWCVTKNAAHLRIL